MKDTNTNQVAVVGLCLLGICLLSAWVFVARNNVVGTQGYDPIGTDFMALYSGARLVGTTHMYDPQTVWKVQQEAIGRYGESLLFTRIPCFALFLWPLAQLPYATAKCIWISLQLGVIVATVFLWPGSRKLAAIVTCWSFPAIMCLGAGSDAPFLFLWLVLWRRLELRGRPVWGGIVLALCIAKFHLFLFLPLLLLRHRRWSVIKGSAIGVFVLVALSYLAAGWKWPVGYLHVLSRAEINPSRTMMPNLHGLVAPELEVPVVILVAVLTCAAIFRFDYIDAMIAALTGSMLCSYHCYVNDGVVLLPALLLVMERYFRPGRASVSGQIAVYAALILITPLPWIAIMMRGR